MEGFFAGLLEKGLGIWGKYRASILLGLLLGATAAGLVWYIRHQNSTIHNLTVENTTLGNTLLQQQQVNIENTKTIAALQQSNKDNIKALEEEHKKRIALTELSTRLKEELRHATPTQDGPVAPILAHLLEQLRVLRQQEGNTADSTQPR